MSNEQEVFNAIKNGNVDIVKKFVESGGTITNIMFNTVIENIYSEDNYNKNYSFLRMINIFIKNGFNDIETFNDAYERAGFSGNYQLARRLIKAGCNITIDDDTDYLFNYAINLCDTEIILKYIESGVKINDEILERIYDDTCREIIKKTQMKHVKSAR